MGIRSSSGCHPYEASDRKTFKGALCHLLQTEFPGIFGPAVTRLFADKIDEPHVLQVRHACAVEFSDIVQTSLHFVAIIFGRENERPAWRRQEPDPFPLERAHGG